MKRSTAITWEISGNHEHAKGPAKNVLSETVVKPQLAKGAINTVKCEHFAVPAADQRQL